MGHTRNRWTMDTPNPDGQIFLDPYQIYFSAGSFGGTFTGTPISFYWTFNTASASADFALTVPALSRTGVLATPALAQEQFGTAALQPGPSAVSGTSSPLGLQNYPPYTNAQNPIYGGTPGPVKKGYQVNSVDVIYSVATNALSAFTIGFGTNTFANNVATSYTSLLATAQNGLVLAVQANPYVIRVANPNPSFTVASDTEFIVNGVITNGAAAATVNIYGMVVNVSFNYN